MATKYAYLNQGELQTFREDLERHRGEHVLVLTDSQAMCRALEVGSRTPAVFPSGRRCVFLPCRY